MKNISKISLLLVLAISLLVIGCKKSEEAIVADETTMENTIDTDATEVDTTTATSEIAPTEVEVTTATV